MEEPTRRKPAQAVDPDREEAVRRLDAIRSRIGRLEGPSIIEDLRRDRGRDEPE